MKSSRLICLVDVGTMGNNGVFFKINEKVHSAKIVDINLPLADPLSNPDMVQAGI